MISSGNRQHIHLSVFQHLKSGVAVYEAVDGGRDFLLIYANPAMEKICHVETDMVIGQSVRKIFPGVVEMGLFAVLQHVYNTGETMDCPNNHYEDRHLSFWAQNHVYKHDSGEVIAIFDDITRYKQTEQDLSRFKMVMDNAMFGHALATLEGEIVYANNYYAKRHGYDPEELIGRKLHILHPDNQQNNVTIFLNSLRTNGIFGPADLDHKHKDGSELIMLTTGTLIKSDLNLIAVYAVDTTEQIKIKEDHIRLATAIQQASDVVVITDHEGTIQYVNPSFERTTGYTSEEAVGHNPRVLKSGVHTPHFYHEMWSTISSGKVWKGRIHNRHKNGTLYTEEASISPVISANGKIANYVAVKHDITRELELECQLQQAVKMEAIGTLAGGIAHDFNNILSAINGYSLMAMESIEPEHEIYDDLQQVIHAGERASNLVNQILLFSSKQEPVSIPIHLALLLKDTHNMLRASLPATIKLHLDIEDNCFEIDGDAGQIQQVFMNLTTNAVYALEKHGGTISFFLANSEGTKEMAEPHVIFRISDTGKGIRPEDMDKIFDPFYTTKPKGEGTGLGLSVVHTIIKNHNGSITVQSFPELGTTFTVRFPATCKTAVMTATPALQSKTGNGEHIMIVDDEPAVGELLKRMVLWAGYKATYFTSSVEALQIFKEDPYACDLLLADMIMPDLDGVALATSFQQYRPDLPIIICTGHKGSLAGRDPENTLTDILCKPIKKEQLINTIYNIIHGTDTDC